MFENFSKSKKIFKFFFQITGQYSVLLPDGRVQTVTYSVAPDTGFVVSCNNLEIFELQYNRNL